MKLLKLTALVAVLFLFSCSKKSTPAPTGPATGAVVINGTTYSTVVIGTQTWMSANYAGPGGTNVSTAAAAYGNYYTLAQAMSVVLPAGWRIPTRADFNNLLSNYTSTKNTSGDFTGSMAVAQELSATTQWEFNGYGTNTTGFNAFPGGYYDPSIKSLANPAADGVYLTSTTGTVNSVTVNYVFAINDDGVTIGDSSSPYYAGIDYFSDPYAFSLRFVKDN